MHPWARRAGPYLPSLLLILFLASVHAAAASDLEATRIAWGASAETVFSRFFAHFTAPAFHNGWGHLAYNATLLLVGLPFAVRRFGARSTVPLAYLASPLAGILVDIAIVLPLAALGMPAAIDAAPRRLVGASVVAFAGIGLALVAKGPRFIVAGTIFLAAYEVVLLTLGATAGFTWCYHLAGLGMGLMLGWGLLATERAHAAR